jgi:CheY-like chemotaxis protein
MCSQLVQLMGGQVEVESEPGIGSTFSFSARLGLSAEGPLRTDLPAEHAPSSPLRILLAEDNLVNQAVATRLLEKQGHSVRLATTGQQAADAVAEERFDLVLMDNQMPVCCGIEATRLIRASGFDVPIVGLSADAMNGDRARFLAAGMNGYLLKPYRADELYAVVRKFASVARAPDTAR